LHYHLQYAISALWISLTKLLAISNFPCCVTAPQIGRSRAGKSKLSFTSRSEGRNCRVQHRRPRAGAVLRYFHDVFRHCHTGQHRQMEVNMRRFLWATPLLFVLISSSAWANSITISLDPNNGSGPNFGFVQQSNRANAVFFAGGTFALMDWGYDPGSTLGGETTVYLDFGEALIRGVYHDLSVGSGSLDMSSFTLPTNGASTFTVPVWLWFGGSVTVADTGQIIDVYGSSKGKITFFRGYDGLYYAGSFTTVPEPGTLGLMGTGLIGIFSVARRRLRIFTRL
jgi:hypothetical protein